VNRAEFDAINSIGEIISVCADYDLNICEDIFSEDEKDEYVEDELCEYIRNHSWDETRDMLNEIPSGYEYYRKIHYLDFKPLYEDDFLEIKSALEYEFDECELWDEETEEEEEEIERFEDSSDADSDEDDLSEEPFGIQELLTSCSEVLSDYEREKRKAALIPRDVFTRIRPVGHVHRQPR
jgi:hypothetical protein